MLPRVRVAVEQRGFLPEGDETNQMLANAGRAVTRELRSGGPDKDVEDCRDRARRALRRFFRHALGRTPLISVAVVELG